MSKFPIRELALLATIALSGCAQAKVACSENDAADVVERFGERLKLVSLLSPSAEQDLRAQYADLVSPILLDRWVLALPEAPGQKVSSPWPDRIEVATIDETTTGSYSVTANIIEMTSWEVTHGGVASEIPIALTVEAVTDRCLITDYDQASQAQ